MMTLPEKIAAKQPGALDEFYAEYHARIHALALRIVRNEWDAEEVVQDVCWTVHRKADTFRGGAFWPWVYRVTQNSARMLLRKQKRVPTPVDGDVIERMIERHDGSRMLAPPPDRIMAVRETLLEVEEELGRMSDTNRSILNDVCMGASLEATGQVHNLSVGAVKARLHRTRTGLRALRVVA